MKTTAKEVKPKQYPYMYRMKQINVYLPKTMWEVMDKWKFVGESRALFMRRAVANLIGLRIKMKKNKLLEETEFESFFNKVNKNSK